MLTNPPNFMSTFLGVNAHLNNVLNVKALVDAFNQEKALVGAFSVIVKTDCEIDGSSPALAQTLATWPPLETTQGEFIPIYDICLWAAAAERDSSRLIAIH